MTHNKNLLLFTGALLFSVFGLMVETLFTGVAAFWQGSFKGGVSLLMIPVYCFSYLLAIWLLPKVEQSVFFKLPLRITGIIIIIYIIEWGFGAAYKSIGLVPWHYEHGWASDFSNGNITLYFLPAWIAFAIIVIPVIRIIKAISPTLLGEIRDQAGK